MSKKLPFLLALLSIVGGVFIAILFGANEGIFKDRIQAGLAQNIKIQAMADGPEKAAKISAEAEKNWRYYQRYHFHATGIGTMTLGMLLLLLMIQGPASRLTFSSYLISIGGFFYPFVWLFAGIYGPEMGRAEAKEAFAIFGYMGGLFLVGGIDAMWLLIRYPFNERLNFSR